MSSQQLIANELLAFVQHAIDTMDEVSILQICKSNFKEDEISSGKKLLYHTLGKLDQMPSYRRDGTAKSIQDIITLLKVTDPDDVPAFVAKELHKLPPVTFDHVDVTRLLKDITTLKTSLAEVKTRLEVSENTISELRAEVTLLRNSTSVSTTHDTSNVSSRRAAQNCSVSSIKPASVVASPATNTASVANSVALENASKIVGISNSASTSCPKRAYAAIAALNKTVAISSKRTGEKQSLCRSVHKDMIRLVPAQDIDKDGFIKVQRKKKKPPTKNQCGNAPSGPNMLLRAETRTTQLYVSRLHHSTKVEEIVEYIRVKTNWTLRVEKLESRHNLSFQSFVVRVPTQYLEKFLKEEFWPMGVVYRRFRGRLHNTAQRNTTPK